MFFSLSDTVINRITEYFNTNYNSVTQEETYFEIPSHKNVSIVVSLEMKNVTWLPCKKSELKNLNINVIESLPDLLYVTLKFT